MRRFYERAHRVHFDGMPVVWMARRLGYALEPRHRVTYVDWIGELCRRAAASGWRLFYLGGRAGVAVTAAECLRRDHPGLQIETRPGYFDAGSESPENLAAVAAIRDFAPQVLLVGMGMPRQERWILENFDRLEANVILNAGACFDYVAGVAATPPRWAGRLGLEWLFRLGREPRRLAGRYLVEPWFILRLFVAELGTRRAA
jgi:N-acetylglucosaminyldiphosphoundecaprenol N-acetyl-beta-D-mannosaminyltransferase